MVANVSLDLTVIDTNFVQNLIKFDISNDRLREQCCENAERYNVTAVSALVRKRQTRLLSTCA